MDEIPFDFSRRRMSVVLEDTSGKRQLITKGAVEEVLSICSYADFGGEIRPLDSEHRRLAEQIYAKQQFRWSAHAGCRPEKPNSGSGRL